MLTLLLALNYHVSPIPAGYKAEAALTQDQSCSLERNQGTPLCTGFRGSGR